ncbi:hypothetical protein Busp01_51210 [Trinickia caryophylli]|uniref:Uncharacterized conserved protein, DUF924 family n=2 Tax=Trinickia caryophylli TaxID=28094 RepID=A0A1X7GVG4_TRICW|nr:hypothetical protein Busp01_51210 [Trinickia caryophylli]SMF75056.1 Uncharacterized conserved protein, DUF924 family [Trinickia caryophylli]
MSGPPDIDTNASREASHRSPSAHAGDDMAGYAALDARAREVLDFWFGEPGSSRFGQPWKAWFSGDPAFDALLRERFGATLAEARSGAFDGWPRTPLGALALIVVLDQFSRNVHRGRREAFGGDARALGVAKALVAAGGDRALPSPHHRAFAYLPFEHDESRESQARAVELFEALSREPGAKGYLGYARQHAVIIERFGRFPHRNAILGRHSTDEERAFLLEPGSSF